MIDVAAIARAAAAVRAGGVVAFPTDTVYGVGCDPRDAAAVAAVYALKGRPAEKPLILLCADPEAAADAYLAASPLARAAARAFWPGAVTLIAPRPASVPAGVAAGGATIGVRVPDHAACRRLLRATGDLATTSANRSGEPAYAGAGEPPALDVAVFLREAGATGGVASAVIDCTGALPRLLREGALGKDEFARRCAHLHGASETERSVT